LHAPSEHAPQRRNLFQVLLGSRDSIAGTVYGTVIVMATIAAGAKGGLLGPGELLGAMIGTVLVLWIAHVYAHGLEESIQVERRLEWHEFVRVAHREWSIALAGVPPGIFLVLGILGVFKESTAIWLALGAGLVVLAAQGVRYAMLERLSPLASIFSVGLNVALGLAIVLLKAGISH
jgi:hypothetical protein